MEQDGATPGAATIEHVMPRSRRGTDALHNLVAACRACNAARPPFLSALSFFAIRQQFLAEGAWDSCTWPSKAMLRLLRSQTSDLNPRKDRFSVEEVLDHLAEHHPTCPPEFRNELAHRVCKKSWLEATLGMAVGITMTDYVRNNFTAFMWLCTVDGIPEADARAQVRLEVARIIASWGTAAQAAPRGHAGPAFKPTIPRVYAGSDAVDGREGVGH